MWSRGAFSLTKTATGILFKFSNIDDFQAVYKKGFHKVTGARFYKKVDIPYSRSLINSTFIESFMEIFHFANK